MLVHLVRHAQGQHNVGWNHNIRDPILTAVGRQQCKELAKLTRGVSSTAQFIVASPMKRTIQTALDSFPDLVKRVGLRVDPMLQEVNDYPCDVGSDQKALEAFAEFAPYNIDFTPCTADWTSKKGVYSTSPSAIRKRCRAVRLSLRQLPHDEIVVVSHGDFLDYFQNEPFFGNAEMRTYRFKDDADATLELVKRDVKGKAAPSSSDM